MIILFCYKLCRILYSAIFAMASNLVSVRVKKVGPYQGSENQIFVLTMAHISTPGILPFVVRVTPVGGTHEQFPVTARMTGVELREKLHSFFAKWGDSMLVVELEDWEEWEEQT